MLRAAPQRYGDVLVTWGDPCDTEPCKLLPAAAFAAGDAAPAPRADLRRRWGAPDEETGENSHTVTWRFFSSCAGWNPPPTAAELHHAVRTSTPDARQQAVIRKWLGAHIDGEDILLLQNASILTGKLYGRGMRLPARDVSASLPKGTPMHSGAPSTISRALPA